MKTAKLIVILILLFCSMASLAQKLTNKQEQSVWAPSNIIIDGKADEWGDQFQSYNKAVDVFYTISNNDSNVYLTLKVIKPRVIEKILDDGLTFVINYAGEKNENNDKSVSITYPALDFLDAQKVLISAGKKAKSDIVVPKNIAVTFDFPDTTDRIGPSNDSLLKIANKQLAIKANLIKVKGLKDIPDDMLSIYNENGIKAAAAFDEERAYVYEICLPLKLLNIAPDKVQKFSYSIKINGRLLELKRGMVVHYIYPNGVKTDVDQDLDATTDFWGEYTLAKKP